MKFDVFSVGELMMINELQSQSKQCFSEMKFLETIFDQTEKYYRKKVFRLTLQTLEKL